jgi:hypothetical protein
VMTIHSGPINWDLLGNSRCLHFPHGLPAELSQL